MSGHLIGPVWSGYQFMQLAADTGWKTIDELVIITAIAFAECDGYINSYNDNMAADGTTVLSRDVGIWEINIPADAIGTHIETDLYVPANNVAAAWKLYVARGFEPWVSYTSKSYLNDGNIDRALTALVTYAATKTPAYYRALAQKG